MLPEDSIESLRVALKIGVGGWKLLKTENMSEYFTYFYILIFQ